MVKQSLCLLFLTYMHRFFWVLPVPFCLLYGVSEQIKGQYKYNKNHWYYLQINQAFLVLLSLSHTVTLEVIGMPFIYSVAILMASTIAVYPFYCIQQTPLFPCLNLHVEIHLVCLSFVHVTIIQLKVLLVSFGTLKPPPTNPQTSFSHITLTSHCSCPHNSCLL